MNKILTAFFAFMLASCQLGSNHDKTHKTRLYQLVLSPEKESRYYFTISNESEIQTEVSERKVTSGNVSSVGLYYTARKDSAGDVRIQTSYDTIHVKTKTAEAESEFDAANASFSPNPVDKMLGALKGSTFSATVTAKGEVKDISGYKKLTAKMLANVVTKDAYTQTLARQQMEELIGKRLVGNNMNQLFKAFPDSGIHIGDTWQREIKQEDPLGFSFLNHYTLEDVSDSIATVSVTGKAVSGKTSSVLNNATVKELSGTQEGEYKVDLKTGMVVSSNLSSKIKGVMQSLGKETSFNVRTKILMAGHKLN